MNKTARNSMIYLGGTVTMGLLGFASTMLLTRILSQQVYAMYGLLTTFSTAVISFISMGHDASYSRFYYQNEKRKIEFLYDCMRIPIGLFAVVLIILLEPNQILLTSLFEGRQSVNVCVLLVLYLLFSLIHRFTRITARMEERAGCYVISNIVGKTGFILVLLMLTMFFTSISFELVLLSFWLASGASVLLSLPAFKGAQKNSDQQLTPVLQKDLFAYGFPYMLNNFLLLLIPLIEKLIIKHLAGWELLGTVTASLVFQTVVLLVVNTVDNIWNPLVFKNHENVEFFKPIMHSFAVIATLLTGLGLAACILLRRWLVLLLDASYYSAYIIAPAIMLSAFFDIIALIYSIGINIQKKTVHHVVCPAVQVVISTFICILLVPDMGIVGVGVAKLVSTSLSRIYKIAVGIHYYDTGSSETKNIVLCVLYIGASLCSLFYTSFAADLVVCMILLVAMCVLTSKEWKPLYHVLKGVLGKRSKEN